MAIVCPVHVYKLLKKKKSGACLLHPPGPVCIRWHGKGGYQLLQKPRLQACHEVESVLQHHHLLATLSLNLFAQLRSAIQCIRGSRSSQGHACKALPQINLVTSVSHLSHDQLFGNPISLVLYVYINYIYILFLITCTKVVFLFLLMQ